MKVTSIAGLKPANFCQPSSGKTEELFSLFLVFSLVPKQWKAGWGLGTRLEVGIVL